MSYLPKSPKEVYEQILLEYQAYSEFKKRIEGKCYLPHDPENVLYLYCNSTFNEEYEEMLKSKQIENYVEPQTEEEWEYYAEEDEYCKEEFENDFEFFDADYEMSSEMDDIVDDPDFWDSFDYEWGD
ncbi:hypothetical protein Calkr_2575 [Caldicellulosiruptor acetigenus I77R1B]|uniref:Uncharacterized protein n=2 Tax=Caldicellulosiruptor acetigenus TaxID=301953 RepID=G2PYP6_9FIRM|nr:hypothetical protein [Caldicellulosiruptor acetigenus]ADQ42000.1 hypothetical protein Calkr_2575 [Caldicellulosiruptor acetigenus I77R1B]AEM74965.1 hypothetical protein Calla_2439 [Caldicellulosiruptor acetigenus 6A]WAM36207.1 hypothetical protein OTK01_002601 [Caldicellulosiruptor acetigenus]